MACADVATEGIRRVAKVTRAAPRIAIRARRRAGGVREGGDGRAEVGGGGSVSVLDANVLRRRAGKETGLTEESFLFLLQPSEVVVATTTCVVRFECVFFPSFSFPLNSL